MRFRVFVIGAKEEGCPESLLRRPKTAPTLENEAEVAPENAVTFPGPQGPPDDLLGLIEVFSFDRTPGIFRHSPSPVSLFPLLFMPVAHRRDEKAQRSTVGKQPQLVRGVRGTEHTIHPSPDPPWLHRRPFAGYSKARSRSVTFQSRSYPGHPSRSPGYWHSPQSPPVEPAP